MTISPDGKWFWDGTQWLPAPPIQSSFTPPPHQPVNPVFTEITQPNLPVLISPSKRKKSMKQPLIVSLVILVMLLSVVLASIYLTNLNVEEEEKPDTVVLSYIYAHTGSEVLATYANQYADVEQDFDYYEGDVIIQFVGDMHAGDTMIGLISVKNFDDDPCGITVSYWVQVNDGELTELIVNTEYSVEKYDEVEVEFIYVHGQHH